MPTVIADNRTLYSGPSKNDAVMIMELARELGVYKSTLKYIPQKGSATPSGLCGKALAQFDDQAKKRVVSEALSKFRKRQEKLGLRKQGWSSGPSLEPPRHVIKNLLSASEAEDFESARREWEYRGEIIFEGETAFYRECDLCGPKERMQSNYLIHNLKTGKVLRVGSVCVKRFLVLAGTSSTIESAQLFDHRTALAIFGQTQKGYIADLGRNRVPEKSVIALIGALERSFPQGLSLEESEIIIQAAGVDVRAREMFKALATKNVKVLKTMKIEKMRNTYPQLRRRKVRSVLTTLSKSEAYRSPDK